MELIGIFVLVIPFVIGYFVGKQAGIKEAQNNDRVDWSNLTNDRYTNFSISVYHMGIKRWF